MRLPVLAAAALLCLGNPTFAAPSDDAVMDVPPVAMPASPLVQAFAQNVGIGNQFEMTVSQLALEKSQDPKVLGFARKMLVDHHRAEMTLEQAAAPSGVFTHFMIDEPHQRKLDELTALSGPAFDEDFWSVQRDAHAETVAAVADYAMTGSDPALRAWAQATYPVIVGHQRMIADLTGTSAVALK